jgi:hypothetical protein
VVAFTPAVGALLRVGQHFEECASCLQYDIYCMPGNLAQCI